MTFLSLCSGAVTPLKFRSALVVAGGSNGKSIGILQHRHSVVRTLQVLTDSSHCKVSKSGNKWGFDRGFLPLIMCIDDTCCQVHDQKNLMESPFPQYHHKNLWLEI